MRSSLPEVKKALDNKFYKTWEKGKSQEKSQQKDFKNILPIEENSNIY